MSSLKKNRLQNSEIGEQVRLVFDYWKEKTGHTKARLDSARTSKIKARLNDGFSSEELCRAVDGLMLSPYHMGENETNTKYDQINLVFRNCDKVEFFIEICNTKAIFATRNKINYASECKFCTSDKKCLFHDPESSHNKKGRIDNGKERNYNSNSESAAS